MKIFSNQVEININTSSTKESCKMSESAKVKYCASSSLVFLVKHTNLNIFAITKPSVWHSAGRKMLVSASVRCFDVDKLLLLRVFSYRSGHGGQTNTLRPLWRWEVTTPARESQRSRGRVNQRGMLSKASVYLFNFPSKTPGVCLWSGRTRRGGERDREETGGREGESAYCFKLGWKNNPALPQLNIVL